MVTSNSKAPEKKLSSKNLIKNQSRQPRHERTLPQRNTQTPY
jgi:hypothetical protein